MKKTSIPKLLAALVAIGYVIWYLKQPYQSTILDAFDLLMHEAGHWIFSFFGNFVYLLGGSLNQILIPLIFVCYFWFKNQKFSASLLLYWVGINFVNVSVYAADAVKMRLPLLGGGNSIHDWNAILIYLGQLRHTVGISSAIYWIGILIITVAAIGSLYYTIRDEKIVS